MRHNFIFKRLSLYINITLLTVLCCSCNKETTPTVTVIPTSNSIESSSVEMNSSEIVTSTEESFEETFEQSFEETFEETSTQVITSSELTTEVESSSIYEEETSEESTTEAPTTQAPTTQAPTTQAPTTQAPTTQAPTTQAPTTQAPTTQAPTTQAPTTQEPTTQAPTTQELSTEESSIVEPSTEEVSTDDSSTEEVSTEDSSTEESSTEESSTEESSTEESSTEESSIEESSTEESSTEESFTEQITTEETSVEETTTEAPSTEPPTTQAPENIAVITNPAKVVINGKTFTGYPSLTQISYSVTDPLNLRGLSTARNGFSFGAASNGKPHQITINNQKVFDSYNCNALAWDNKTSRKVLYLTFDCGYVYGDLVTQILDTLKVKNVPATFFCTLSYLEKASKDVTRMIKEGHIVGNHTTTHPSYNSSTTRSSLAWELLGVHNYMRVNFGYNCKYFRFPEGAYSRNALDLVDSLGYHSVFWSIAHSDWDPANQPGVDVSFNTVTSRLHPGAVILLHSTSPDNAAILGDFIDYARAQGYEFRSLEQYPYWTE